MAIASYTTQLLSASDLFKQIAYNLELDNELKLTSAEYAKMRGCSEATVARERLLGKGCPFIKIGRLVRYRKSDVLIYLDKHRLDPTR
jgi:hypothetical protein